jgi:hypothetical protein
VATPLYLALVVFGIGLVFCLGFGLGAAIGRRQAEDDLAAAYHATGDAALRDQSGAFDPDAEAAAVTELATWRQAVR